MSTYAGEEMGGIISGIIGAIVGVSKEVTATSELKYATSIDNAHAAIAKEEQDAADAVAARRKAESDKKFTDIARTGAIITAVVVAAVVLGTKGAKK